MVGAVCLRRRAGEFERGDGRLLQFVADHVSSILERTDQARIHDARARLDRKVSEQLQPRDLFYQILHLLRVLTRYDHSSALLMTTDGGDLDAAGRGADCVDQGPQPAASARSCR